MPHASARRSRHGGTYHPTTPSCSDAEEVAVYLGEEAGEAIAERFLDRLRATLGFLLETPGAGRERTEFASKSLDGLCSWPVKGFEKHLIFYRPTEAGIEVVRVLHGARDLPGLLE